MQAIGLLLFRSLIAAPWLLGGLALAGGMVVGRRPPVPRSWARLRGLPARRRRLERQADEQTRQMAALNATAAVISRSLHLQEILDGALEKTLEVTQLEAGGFYLLEVGGSLRLAAHRGLGQPLAAAIDRLQSGEGFSGHVALTGEPLIVPDVAADPRLTRLAVQEDGFHSLVVVPVAARGRAVGTLFLITRGRREFSPRELDLLTSIGQQVGVAVENSRLFEEQERRADQFRALNEVGQRIASILDVPELLREVARLIHERFHCHLVVIGLLQGDELAFRAGAGDLWESPSFVGIQPVYLKAGEHSVVGWVAASGQACLVRDVSREPRYLPVPGSRTRSEFVAPIRATGAVIGVVDVESDRLDDFDDTDVDLITSVANQLGVALENARLFAAEQRRAEQFRVIAEVSRRLATTLDIDVLLQQTVELVQKTFGYYHVGIGLIEGDVVVYRVGAGALWNDPRFQFRPARLKIGQEGLTGWVARNGQPLLVPDVSRDPRYVLMLGSQARSELVVPILAKGQTLGVLDVQSDRLNAFDQKDQVVLEALASQAGAAIENARLYLRAQELAIMEERGRLARDLHDSVTQALYGMTLYAQAAASQLAAGNTARVAEHLAELQATSQDALAEMRLLIFELRPPVLTEEGLAAALQARLLAVEGRAGLKAELNLELEGRLPLPVEEGLYRIAQEALNNALKHAHARRIQVDVRKPPAGRRLTLEVADDGLGFDPLAAEASGGLGLAAMRERAAKLGGRLHVHSQPGQGTHIQVEMEL